MKGIGRNDPCPCGSGKKYKKCCMELDKESARENLTKEISEAEDPILSFEHKSVSSEAEANFQKAYNYLRSSQFTKAEKAFKTVINLDRNDFRAMFGLGLCFMNMGHIEEACEWFEKALSLCPSLTQARVNLELCRREL